MSDGIRSYSGTHAFDETHLAGCSDELRRDHAEAVAGGLCPRCRGPLIRLPDTAENYPPPWAGQPKDAFGVVGEPGVDFEWFPAGSKVTFCRCIPICGACAYAEGILSIVTPRQWPLSEERLRRERDALEKQSRRARRERVNVADINWRRGHSGGWADIEADDEGAS